MNATAFHDYERILRVTTLQRQSPSTGLMRWTALLLACAGLAIAALALARDGLTPLMVSRLVLGLGSVWLGVVYLLLFIPASTAMNSAANARLLPRQRRRLMQMAVAGWLLTTVAASYAMGKWMALPMIGLTLLDLAVGRAGLKSMPVIALVACNWPLLSLVLPLPAVVALESLTSVLILTVPLLLVGAWALRRVYPEGGDAHRKLDLRRAGKSPHTGPREAWSPVPDDRFAPPGGRGIYAAALRSDGHAAGPDALLLHALGPTAHWTFWIGSAGIILALGVAVRLVLHWFDARPGHDLALGVATLSMGTLAIAILFSTTTYVRALSRTGGEQAMLRLTPLAGDATPMNRRLARQLLRNALSGWAVLTVAVLGATLLADIGAGALLRQGALCCLAGQMALMGLLGDYARGDVWNLRLGLTAAVLAAVEGAIAITMGSLTAGSPWPWLIALSLLGTVPVLRFGWRRMLAAPPAFPAGRLD